MYKQCTKLTRAKIGWNITHLWWKEAWGIKCAIKEGFHRDGYLYRTVV